MIDPKNIFFGGKPRNGASKIGGERNEIDLKHSTLRVADQSTA